MLRKNGTSIRSSSMAGQGLSWGETILRKATGRVLTFGAESAGLDIHKDPAPGGLDSKLASGPGLGSTYYLRK